MSIDIHHVNVCGWLLGLGAWGVPDFPQPRSWMQKLEPYFSLVEKGLSTQQVVVVLVASGLPQAEGIGELSGHPCKSYMKTSPSSFHFSLANIVSSLFIPLTLLVFCFFFPSVCWLALGVVDCTLCTSDIWVAGAAELGVWLATVC
jgi:hypothetical protein